MKKTLISIGIALSVFLPSIAHAQSVDATTLKAEVLMFQHIIAYLQAQVTILEQQIGISDTQQPQMSSVAAAPAITSQAVTSQPVASDPCSGIPTISAVATRDTIPVYDPTQDHPYGYYWTYFKVSAKSSCGKDIPWDEITPDSNISRTHEVGDGSEDGVGFYATTTGSFPIKFVAHGVSDVSTTLTINAYCGKSGAVCTQ